MLCLGVGGVYTHTCLHVLRAEKPFKKEMGLKTSEAFRNKEKPREKEGKWKVQFDTFNE